MHNIMRKNIEDVIGRADKLNEMGRMSSNLLQDAQGLRSGATKLNQLYCWRTYGPIIVVFMITALVLLIRFYVW